MIYSVSEFCAAYRISRGLFYNMVREGRGPGLMKVGRRTLISQEAAEDWRRQMEQATRTERAVA
jgi:hypothetical protein